MLLPGWVTALTAAYGLFYLIWAGVAGRASSLLDLAGNVAFWPLNAALTGLLLLASGQTALDPRVRRALRLLGIGSALLLIGNAAAAYAVVVQDRNPPLSWMDVFSLTHSLLVFAALLCFPLAHPLRVERWKFLLDAAMVLIGGGIAVWYFTLPAGSESHASGGTISLLPLARPLASLLVLLGVTAVVPRRPVDGNRLAFRLLVAGVLAGIGTDMAFDVGRFQVGEGMASLIDGACVIFFLLMVASAELYYRHPVPRETWSSGPARPAQPVNPLPYLAVAITYGIMLADALERWQGPLSLIVIGGVVSTILLVTRELLAVRQNVRLLAETTARQTEVRFRSLVQHSSDVIFVISADGTISFVSPAVARVLRYDAVPLVGQAVIDLVAPDDRGRARTYLRDVARARGVSAPVEWRFHQPDGSLLHAEIIATNLLEEPTVRGIVLNTRDVSERKRLEQQLTHQAFHDPLTGLANRALFRDRVSHALTLARRQGHTISVLFLDLDDFKKVNDSLGHAEGDRLLVAAADRFRSSARAADTIARLGGDEFAILVEDLNGAEGHGNLLERLSAAMARPFTLSGNEVHVSSSIGIAVATAEDTADDLLRNADMAMYTAKRRGKARSETYHYQMHSDVKHRLEMEAALRAAIEREELSLVYQPIVSMRTGAVRGVEALVRWEHPFYGHLLPQHFVPLAEETGLIVQLGRWVLREACQQLRRWRQSHPDNQLLVSVNVSGRQLHELDIVQETRQALADTRVPPESVMLEITESVLMQETDSVLTRLHELKALGVRLAIDDFGTGYSSLSYLQRFPIGVLKIAKPFVEEVACGVDKSALARAIIGLGQTLKLSTIAEGVEIAEQRIALMGLGCEWGQGFYFAPPLPPEGIVRLLTAPGSLSHEEIASLSRQPVAATIL
jgi:diguanylate cyclase (GGDEF)-like protein/PAS domain S-box-containing protein